jgi:hypothetical protein
MCQQGIMLLALLLWLHSHSRAEALHSTAEAAAA